MIFYILTSLILAGALGALARKTGPWLLQVAFAASVATCVITASKIAELSPDFFVSAAVGLYSVTFLMTDSLSELYGKREAQRAIWMGLVAELILVFGIIFTLQATPAPFWELQDQYKVVFGTAPRIMLGSILAYLAAQFWDVHFYHWLKGRVSALWVRNNLSTMTSQAIDTAIFYTIALWGTPNLLKLMFVTWLVKLAIAAADTPVLYFIRWVHTSQWTQSTPPAPKEA